MLFSPIVPCCDAPRFIPDSNLPVIVCIIIMLVKLSDSVLHPKSCIAWGLITDVRSRRSILKLGVLGAVGGSHMQGYTHYQECIGQENGVSSIVIPLQKCSIDIAMVC